jgi:putative chitinase
MCIATAVGQHGYNHASDVKTLQILINMNIEKLSPLEKLAEDGLFGDATLNAIKTFQMNVSGLSQPDGKVSPDGPTLQKLSEGIPTLCNSVLKGIYINAGDADIERYIRFLVWKMADYDIKSPLRKAHFLAQLGQESAELRTSEAFTCGDAYEGQKDLGNIMAGDGRRFKGRGLIQLVGRANYTAYSKARGKDYTSDEGAKLLATDPETAVDVACWFWATRDLNRLADLDDIATVTRRLSGGLSGLEDRRLKLMRAKFFLRP